MKYHDFGNAKVEETLRKVEELGNPSHPTNCKNCGAVLKGSTCEYCGTKYNKRTIKYWANNRVVHEEEI